MNRQAERASASVTGLPVLQPGAGPAAQNAREGELSGPRRPQTIECIVESGLCVRCGGCAAVCPPDDVIALDDDSYPRVRFDGCIDCHCCLDVCPMNDMNIPELYRSYLGRAFTPEQYGHTGPMINVYVGCSTDPGIRSRGSSGGVGVQILVSLLEFGHIDAATAVVPDADRPYDFVAKLGRTKEELLSGSGSKYTIVPLIKALRDFWKSGERIAVVGLPCHLQSLRLWERLNSKVRRNVELRVGLFCATTLTKQASMLLLKRVRIKPKDVAGIDYRKGEWPGGICVWLRNGQEKHLHDLDIKYGAFNYLSKTYFPKACLNCVDYCADFSDIALADPWVRAPNGDYLYEGGWTLIITRTERGERTLQEVADRGALVLKRIDPELFLRSFARLAEDKYSYALRRIQRLCRRNKAYPRFHLPEPRWTLGRRWRVWLYAAERMFALTEFTRRVYVYGSLSPPGVAISKVKATLKRWRFRRRFAKFERTGRPVFPCGQKR